MIEEEQYYFRSRAEEELAAAVNSTNVESAEIHRTLARLYLSKADEQPTVEADERWSTA